jgi:hypothetical protein
VKSAEASAVKVKAGSLLSGLPPRPRTDEVTKTLCEQPGTRIERIVSTGQATPDGQWYDARIPGDHCLCCLFSSA